MLSILIANPKGGVGKSTLSTNLAGWLAKSGKRVMLSDIDRQQLSRAWPEIRSPLLPYIATWDIAPGKPARPPKETTHVVLDSPAGLHGKKLNKVLAQVNYVIVPVQPSIFDILATQSFLTQIIAAKRFRDEAIRVAVVGMRINARPRAVAELERFLADTSLPIIAHLCDNQNYIQAATHGMSIFDMTASQAAQDWEQWASLIQWVDPLQ